MRRGHKAAAFFGGIAVGMLMTLVVACSSGATGGATTPSGSDVYYWHDAQHEVSCWLYGSSGTSGKAISCLPDTQVHK